MRFSLLGPLKVEHLDSRLEIGGGKPQIVLSALILARGKVVPTDRLVNLIWGDEPPAKPYVTMRSYISHLRRILEPERGAGDRGGMLVTRSPGYALEVAPESVDAFRFEHQVAEAGKHLEAHHYDTALAGLNEALALWYSDDLQDSPVWLFGAEAHRLMELRRQAIAMRFDALLESGQHYEIIADLQSLVDADPTSERHRAQLMLALHRSGRQGEAIAVFQSGVKATIDASGLDISHGLAELEQRILNNDPGLDWQPGQQAGTATTQPNTPAVVEAPIGRAPEATTIDNALAAKLTPASTSADTAPTQRFTAPTQKSAEGTEGFVAVTGEPGIGKSKMLDYAATKARAGGAVVAWGFGHNGSQNVPLVPWRVLLSNLVDLVDDTTLADLVGLRGPELAQLVPTIGDRLGFEPVEASDASVLREAFARFLIRIATNRPLLLCLDDLHWVDTASVQLLSYILPQLRDAPVMAIGSWRSTEVLEPELTQALAELSRLAAGNRIELEGLSLSAVGQVWAAETPAVQDDDLFSADLSPQSPQWAVEAGPPGQASQSAMAELHRRTAGNPLFITELIRSASDPAELRPTATVNDVIASRLATLPPACSDLLTIAALCLGNFDERLLAELSGLGQDELIDALELLLSTRLIVEDPQDVTRFTLSHSLIGESLAMQMSGLRKAKLHTRIAEVLEQQRAPLGELAHHYLQGVAAGDRATAATAGLAAARHNSKLHDHAGAIELIRRSLAVLEQTDDTQVLRAELMISLAHELKFLEQVPESHGASLEGFELADRAGDVDQMVNAALVYCGQGGDESNMGLQWLGYWNPPGPALEMLRHCIDKMGEGRERTTVLMAYASQLFGDYANPTEAVEVFDQAIVEARLAADPQILPTALYHRFNTLQRSLSYEQRRDALDECLQLASSKDLILREVSVRRSLMVLRLDEDDINGAKKQLQTSFELAAQLDNPSVAMIADSMSIAIDLYQGRLAQAEIAITEAFTTYERVGSAALDVLGIQLAVLQREQGHLDQVGQLMRWKLHGYPGPAYGMALAMVLAEQGNHDEARALIAEYEGSSIESGGEGVLQFMTLAFYAQTLAELNDADRAASLYEALQPAAGRVISMFNGIVVFGSGSYYLGRLATVLGRFDEANVHLAAAAQHHLAVGSKPYQLRTLLAQADLAAAVDEASDALGDPSGAGDLRTQAAALAETIDMTWMLQAP
ncbi:MAG: BTAD domain-containing putative transcriptional regulator [Acidimicrobiales bacterium]